MAMTNYLTMAGDASEHYFFRPYEGICKRNRLPGGSWTDYESVIPSAKDCFCVYSDKNSNVHIISYQKHPHCHSL